MRVGEGLQQRTRELNEQMYLKRLGLQIGLLANFHDVSLQPEVIRISEQNSERDNEQKN